MNTIKINQDKPENLRLLAAQRVAYKRAKVIFIAQIIVTVVFAVAFNIIRLIPKEKIIDYLPYIITVSLGFTFLDLLYFLKYISKMKTNAAKVQEQFDCNVYEMPWNKFTCGNKPDKNFIHENYQRYIPDPKKPIENWYDIDLTGLSQEKAILLCQETNLWYDANLREKFKNFALVILGILIAISVLTGLIMKLEFGLLLLYVVAPLLPAIVLVIKIYQENEKSISASNDLKKDVLALKQLTNNPSMAQLRQIQDKIFCSRKDSSLVPERFYQKKRPKLEDGMKINAQN